MVRDALISRGLPIGFEESLIMRDRGAIHVSLGTLLAGGAFVSPLTIDPVSLP